MFDRVPGKRAGLAALLIVIIAALGVGGWAAFGRSDDGGSDDGGPTSGAVLKVGTEGTYSPFSYTDESGRLTGFDVEVIRAIGAKIDRPIDFVQTPWDSMFAALGSGQFDLVANQVTYSDERRAIYALSDTYVQSAGVIVTRAGDDSIKTVADLRGKSFAQNVTSNWADVVRDNGGTVVPVNEFAAAISALESGHVDAIINDELVVRSYLAETGSTSVQIAGETPDTSNSVFAARAEDAALITQVNAALADLKADGTIDDIYAQYFSGEASTRTTWEVVRAALWPMLKSTVTSTLPLTAISFVVGLAIALVVALARMSQTRVLGIPLLSWLARIYISIIRGTPLLVQLFLIFFGLPQLGIDFDPFPAAIIAFSLNVGGYAAEIIRASITSVDRGQSEAATALGMTYVQSLRQVVLPQAARVAVPPLSNTLISLVKDTSLASTILVTELFRQAQVAAAPTYEFMALYSAAAVYYWVVCLILSFGQDRLEDRLGRYV